MSIADRYASEQARVTRICHNGRVSDDDIRRQVGQLLWIGFDGLETSVELMKIMARACGHSHLKDFSADDLVTWKHDMARLSGVPYAGVSLN